MKGKRKRWRVEAGQKAEGAYGGLTAVLNRLETVLIQKGAARLEHFRQGLTVESIREQTAALPFQITEEVVTLYAWHDGIEGVDLFPGLSLISFGRALSLCQVYLDFDPWLPNRFPVLSSGGCTHFGFCGPSDQ